MFKYLVLFLLLGLEPFAAQAYLDPGTGSFIIQIVIAAVAGALFTLKTYWVRGTRWMRGILRKGDKENDS